MVAIQVAIRERPQIWTLHNVYAKAPNFSIARQTEAIWVSSLVLS